MNTQTSAMRQTKNQAMKLSLGALAFGVFVAAQAAAPVIGSLSKNGVLACTNLARGSVATIEWGPSVTGPWTNNWAGLEAVTADSNGMIQVSVPMFYRVLGVPVPPPGMALIPAGSFTMGDTFSEDFADQRPTHTVDVSAFYMDRTEVTKGLWDTVKAYNGGNGYSFDRPGLGKAMAHPVHTVNWYDAVKWCNARSQKEGLTPCYYTDSGLTAVYKTSQVAPYVKWTANGYRLPTEAEWEKAARGGLGGKRFPWGDTISESQANYYGNTGAYGYDLGPSGYNSIGSIGGISPATSPAGSFAANGYGLCDMAGNVWEWCWDWYGSYSSGSQTDPSGPGSGPTRVIRGGSWDHAARDETCAQRNSSSTVLFANYNTGFRCVRGH